MNKIQILYHAENDSQVIAKELQEEAAAMQSADFMVGTSPIDCADYILYRGPTMWNKESYPIASNLIQGWTEYQSALFMSIYYPYIQDLSIPTFFCNDLDDSTEREIIKREWGGAFVKNDVSAFIEKGQIRTIWPDTPFDEMKALFSRLPYTGTYSVRKRIRLKLYEEERYWILNNHPYHHTGIIPDIVNEAINRLKPINNHYYVIDATPQIIVEINPGESSDRYIDNTPALFASWFREEFLYY